MTGVLLGAALGPAGSKGLRDEARRGGVGRVPLWLKTGALNVPFEDGEGSEAKREVVKEWIEWARRHTSRLDPLVHERPTLE